MLTSDIKGGSAAAVELASATSPRDRSHPSSKPSGRRTRKGSAFLVALGLLFLPDAAYAIPSPDLAINFFASAAQIFGLATLVGMLLAWILGLWISNRVTRPLERLTDGVTVLATGRTPQSGRLEQPRRL